MARSGMRGDWPFADPEETEVIGAAAVVTEPAGAGAACCAAEREQVRS